MKEIISRRRFLKLTEATASGCVLAACEMLGPRAPERQTETAALPSLTSTEAHLPSSTSTPEPTKTLTPVPSPTATQTENATSTLTELPPITEGGREILKKVVENCPGPVRYEGSYRGIKIPVTFSTDESYGNVVVKLANPAYANRLAEMAADVFFRAGYKDTHPEMSPEDFMRGWKDGTIDRVTIPANRPENSKYHAEPAEMPLTDLGLHIVFVDHNNYRFKGKLFEKNSGSNASGLYLNNNELVLLTGLTGNHMMFSKTDTDPYGPGQDLIAALCMIVDNRGSINSHFEQIMGYLAAMRATKCSQ